MTKTATKKVTTFAVGDRVSYYCESSDTGTVRRVVMSRYSPGWDEKDDTPLDRPIPWYFVEWDVPADGMEPDPILWYVDSDLAEVRS